MRVTFCIPIKRLKDKRVRGVLLWNVWEKADDARELIAEPGPFSAKNLKDRIK